MTGFLISELDMFINMKCLQMSIAVNIEVLTKEIVIYSGENELVLTHRCLLLSLYSFMGLLGKSISAVHRCRATCNPRMRDESLSATRLVCQQMMLLSTDFEKSVSWTSSLSSVINYLYFL